MGKFHWVSDDVKIDFKISVVMKNTMEEAEQLDLEESPEYAHVADILDVMGKEAFVNKLITRKQWDAIVERYPYSDS